MKHRLIAMLNKSFDALARMPRRGAHWLIRGYQLSLSMLIGRQCRHWPSCSDYTDEAIQRFGLWRGGWVGVARICRCTPLGTSGIDLVCEELPPDSRLVQAVVLWPLARRQRAASDRRVIRDIDCLRRRLV